MPFKDPEKEKEWRKKYIASRIDKHRAFANARSKKYRGTHQLTDEQKKGGNLSEGVEKT